MPDTLSSLARVLVWRWPFICGILGIRCVFENKWNECGALKSWPR